MPLIFSDILFTFETVSVCLRTKKRILAWNAIRNVMYEMYENVSVNLRFSAPGYVRWVLIGFILFGKICIKLPEYKNKIYQV